MADSSCLRPGVLWYKTRERIRADGEGQRLLESTKASSVGTDGPILVVEDDITLAQAVSGTLRREGFPVESAYTHEEAQLRIQEKRPALLVLDLLLPDGSGWEILKAARARTLEVVPVIIISHVAVTRAQIREHGVQRFIPKPFDMRDLVQEVRHLLAPPS